MNDLLLPILIASTVALLVWWGISLFSSAVNGEQRRLQQRLSTEAPKTSSAAHTALSIVLPEDGKMPDFLARKPFVQRLQRKLLQVSPDLGLKKFLIVLTICAAVPGLFAFALSANALMAVAAVAIGGYLPVLVLNFRHSKRQRRILDQLPEALDFLGRVMRAGHSLSTGFQMMSDEMPPPLATEFRKCYDQHSLGQPLEDGLRDMSHRIDSTDFHFFVTAVLIQKQTGGDLAEVLDNISGMIRDRMRLSRHVRAKTAEGRFTGYIMVAFPAVMFGLCYFLNPELYGKFLTTHLGLILLATAVGLQVMGLFMIKKITTVKV